MGATKERRKTRFKFKSAPDGIRTHDFSIKSRILCHLSYWRLFSADGFLKDENRQNLVRGSGNYREQCFLALDSFCHSTSLDHFAK